MMEKNKKPEEAGIEAVFHWENAKNRVRRKVVNAGKKHGSFKDAVCTPFLDLEEQYYMGGTEKGCLVTVIVTESLLGNWGITKEELEAQAVENMRRDGYRMEPVDELLGTVPMPEQDRMYAVTNRDGVFGAAVITEPEILAELAAQIGGDAYILPSSVHELLLIPACTRKTADWLRCVVRAVNREEIPGNEFLSDNIYYFYAAEKRVEIIPEKQRKAAV